MSELPAAPASVPPKVGLIDIAAAWSSVFQDPSLLPKLLIGSALHLSCWLVLPLPFSLPVLIGYAVLATRNTVAGEEHPLPAWEGFGEMWMLGLSWVIALCVFMVPFALGMAAMFGLFVGGIALQDKGGEVLQVAAVILYYLLVFGGSLVGLLMRLTLFPIMHLQLARHGTLGSLFSFREMWDLFRSNPWNVLLAAVLEYAGSFLVSFGFCLCLIPAAPIWFLVQAITAVNLGRAERLRMQAYGELTGP